MSTARLEDHLGSLRQIAENHRKCLSCHCYRDVVERAVDLAGAHGPAEAAAIEWLSGALESAEGEHG